MGGDSEISEKIIGKDRDKIPKFQENFWDRPFSCMGTRRSHDPKGRRKWLCQLTKTGPAIYICEAEVDKREDSLVWKSTRDKWGYASNHTLSLPPGARTDDAGQSSTAAWHGETTRPEDTTAREKRLKRQRNLHDSLRIWVEDDAQVG